MDNHTSNTVGSCVHCSHEGQGEMDCLFPLKMGHASSLIPSQAHVHDTHLRVKFRLNNFRGTESVTKRSEGSTGTNSARLICASDSQDVLSGEWELIDAGLPEVSGRAAKKSRALGFGNMSARVTKNWTCSPTFSISCRHDVRAYAHKARKAL